ncbi:MAG: class I SAM-dependent methyltransferase [Elusimicrobia bacterium]|nr:class I SAM-dependent methyltransferase [Candidatus Obscuribacterium magneticum]
MKILDLGCGAKKTPGATGIDLTPQQGVDIVHDLEVTPYPIADNVYDRIVIRHVIEHINNVVGLMQEVHRIGKRGATVEIHTPHYTSLNSYIDPAHRHHFSLFAFDIFCGNTDHGYNLGALYRLKKRTVEFWPLVEKPRFIPYHFLGLKWFIERHPHFYERFLAFLFPLKEFHVELEILK